MTAKVGLMTADQIGAHKARLAQYADVLTAFHDALIDCHMPADAARECVVAWWESELTWEGS